MLTIVTMVRGNIALELLSIGERQKVQVSKSSANKDLQFLECKRGDFKDLVKQTSCPFSHSSTSLHIAPFLFVQDIGQDIVQDIGHLHQSLA